MKKTIFAMFAGFLATGAALAQTTQPTAFTGVDTAPHAYVGIGIGAVKESISSDYKRTTKIFGGYEFDRNWAVEAGYTYLGKTGFSIPQDGYWAHTEMKGFATYAAARYTVPLGERSAVYGKLGLSHTENEYRSEAPSWNVTDRYNGLYAAAGLQYKLTEKVSMFAEYERYGKRQANGPENHVLNAGLKYGF